MPPPKEELVRAINVFQDPSMPLLAPGLVIILTQLVVMCFYVQNLIRPLDLSGAIEFESPRFFLYCGMVMRLGFDNLAGVDFLQMVEFWSYVWHCDGRLWVKKSVGRSRRALALNATTLGNVSRNIDDGEFHLSKVELVVRIAADMLVNRAIRGFLSVTLPIMLANSESGMVFVFNSMAMTFVMSIDNLAEPIPISASDDFGYKHLAA